MRVGAKRDSASKQMRVRFMWRSPVDCEFIPSGASVLAPTCAARLCTLSNSTTVSPWNDDVVLSAAKDLELRILRSFAVFAARMTMRKPRGAPWLRSFGAARLRINERLVRVLVTQSMNHRHEQDLHVQHQRPVLDVVEVVLDAHADRGVAAPAVHLRPAGHAGAHFVAQHVLRELGAELLDELRALRPRPDHAHVAEEHVEELRQLVERPGADQAAHSGAPGIVALRPLRAGLVLRADAHRAELEDVERLAV